ncbi:hypothetical protein GCM10023340_44490 [Nocardioides marinquilinus]|uniref:Peptidase M14 domain-containing protein n=1 Tax=Nocardioides marinquilinus TaxID=1210400 RepID=A0ABP9Q3P0_9ACTN
MNRTLTAAAGAVLALALPAAAPSVAAPVARSAPAPAAPAEPDPQATEADARGGRGAGTATRGLPADKAEVVRRAAAAIVAGDPIEMPTSYPYQPQLRFYRDNPDDASDTAELLGHPDLAPQLTEWMAASDRISTQVVGQSTQGRDLYLVTVTAPESEDATAEQSAWRELIHDDPEAAAADPRLLSQYKTPIWISNNIHGNEWEGTDATMRYIDWLVSAPQAEVGSILRNNRLYFSLSLNPDGRTNATRATALGFDPNRDMITNSTPETRSYIRTAQAIQPIYSADFHGYTRVLQMEPCGPPHGSNYEYDLYLPHNYALALKVEQDVVAANIPGNTYYAPGQAFPNDVTTTNTGFIKIPYRDTPSGWDDFPPIFTAQYSAFYGAATATVELPLQRGAANGSRQSPANARVNTAVGTQTVESIVEYLNDATTAREMLSNQIEVFRRGAAGEPKKALTTADVAAVPGPSQWKPLWDVVDDQEPVTLPRAYVIPVGEGQRSASDATRLVEQLLLHDIEVGRLTDAATVGGTTYPAGSYVVDLHQPLRGLANALLDLGEDISAKVPSMYDISAWSWSYLWGATVDKVGLTTDAPVGATEPVTAPTPVASMPDGGYLTFEVAGVRDYAAVDALLDDGVAVSMLDDASVVVAPADRAAVAAVAQDFDLAVTRASADDLAALDDETTRGLSDLAVGYVGTQDDRVSLEELGFDAPRQLTAAALNATPTLLDDVDVLWVGTTLTLADGSAGRNAVQRFVASGRSIVGRGSAAFTAAQTYGLLPSSAAVLTGNGSSNGIVDVDTPDGSLLADHAQDSSFVSPAAWFTGPEGAFAVEQTYAADPFLAGHWRPGTSGGNPLPNGPADAAGRASVISNEYASGARTVVFGTSVFYRNHPKGLIGQAGRAIYWAGPEGPEVAAPGASTVSLTAPDRVAYPGAVAFQVTATAADVEAASGRVDVVDGAGQVVGSAPVDGGTATVRVSGLRPGTASYTAVFTSETADVEGSTSTPVQVTVTKAVSTTGLRVVEKSGRAVTVRVTLRIAGLTPRGTVRLNDRGRLLRTVRLDGVSGTATKTVTVRLPAGSHALRAVYDGTDLVARSASSPVAVTTR